MSWDADAVDSFARLYVLPQTEHGLSGRAAPIDGDGNATDQAVIPIGFDSLALLQDWIENGVAPGKVVVVTGGTGSLPMCSYPEYPHYEAGDASVADSFACAVPAAFE